MITFIKESYQELKKTTWPSKKQTTNYTIAVVIASIAVAMFLGALDVGFSSVVEKFLF